jgi:hypothetical protein
MFFSSYVFQIDRVGGKPISRTKRLSLVSGQKKGGLFYVNALPNSIKSATILSVQSQRFSFKRYREAG